MKVRPLDAPTRLASRLTARSAIAVAIGVGPSGGSAGRLHRGALFAGIGFLSPAQSPGEADPARAGTGADPGSNLNPNPNPAPVSILDIVSCHLRGHQRNGGPAVVNLMARLGGRGRHNGANAIVHLAREVVGRRRTIQNATQEVRNAVILDSLADEDFRALDTTIAERTTSDREFAQTLARLTYAAARAKGFDRCVVDAALRLDSLVPVDDPAHERDKLLRDAYNSAQKASYIRGGRLALGRLGRRAVEAGDLERARVLLNQQLDLGPEKDDTAAEVDSALVLGDILRRGNEDDQAQAFYRRAGTAAERLEYRQGVAEALVRQIDTTPSTNLETVTALQHQALDAAQRTGDHALEARILVGLADTLVKSGRLEDATPSYRNALSIARDTGDLAMEARCVTALAHLHRDLGQTLDAIEAERAALGIEERLGNRPAAANWALSLGMSELRLRNAESAIEAFERARLLGNQIGDEGIEQRAEGNLGIAHTLLGHGSETIDHLGRAIDLARRAGDQSQEAQWVSSLGEAYWMFGQIDDAIRLTNDAIGLAEATRDVTMQAESFTLLGQIYASQRETIRARDCYTRALQLNRDLGKTADQVTTLTALATLAANTGQFTQATQLFDQALQLSQSSNDRSTMTVLYGRMGSLAQKRGDMRTALGNYQRSVESAQSVGDSRLLGRALQYLATAQDLMGDPHAVTTYERAVTAADEAGDIRGGITMRLNMGMLISRLPEQGAVEDAIGWLSDAANYAMEAGADYNGLRRQAEERIQDLGGGTKRSNEGLDYRSAQSDPERYPEQEPDRYDEDRLEARDSRRRDDANPFPDRDGQERSARTARNRYDEDERYADERYEDDDLRESLPYDAYDNERRRAISATGRGDDDDAYAPERRDDRSAWDEPESGVKARYSGTDREHDRYRSDPSRFGRNDDGSDERNRDRYDDAEIDGRYAADRDPEGPRFSDDRWDRDPRYDHDSGQRQSRASDEDWYPSDSPAFQALDRDDRPDDRVDDSVDGYHDGYGRPTYAGDRNGHREQQYTDDRIDDRGRDGSGNRFDDEPRGRSRRGGPDTVYGASSSGYGADRYDEDTEPGYGSSQDNNPEYYPPQRSGRTERTSRRETGGRVSLGRGLDDEPSDPAASTPARRRAGLSNLFRPSRQLRTTDVRPEDVDRSVRTLAYEGQDEPSQLTPG